MTTQQDSVDVERLRVALEAQMETQDENLPNSIARERGLVWLEGWFDLSAALSLPITRRDEQAKTYADGVEDAARYVEGHGGVIPGATAFIPMVTGDRMPCMSGDGRDRLMPARRREFDDATRSLASAIRRLSIEQGDQDGGAE